MKKEVVIYKIFQACDQYNRMKETLDTEPLSLVEGVGTDITETKLQELFATLILLETDEKTMLEGIVEQIRLLEARKKRAEACIENIRKTFLNSMQFCNIEKIRCPIATISRTMSPPKVTIEDDIALLMNHPEYFKAQDPKLDKKTLLDDLKNGVLIEGAKLEQNETITIRK